MVILINFKIKKYIYYLFIIIENIYFYFCDLYSSFEC